MNKIIRYISFLIAFFSVITTDVQAQKKSIRKAPNVVVIYADDLGYGDLSCYGATKIQTPNLDKLAKNGIRFTNGHSTSATCTPSRYALMTGVYPWRKSGTSILPGDAALIIPQDKITLPGLFKKAGYHTALVGKWHLGIGEKVEKDWNGVLKPGPNEVGFDYSFIFPATADRVPTVFVENSRVVALDSTDPIAVSYKERVGNDPIVTEHPELLKMKSVVGHSGTIINGIGRIGYMSGGKKARWTDEEMPLSFLFKAKNFISANREKPFFLFYALTEPHVPRMPSTMFKGKSGLGYRGDAILQLDWTVGEIMKHLQLSGLAENTIVIFSSDNGPVLNDGYDDEAETQLNGHTPWGIFKGGKYSTYEAGSRVPLIISWPALIKPQVSNALISQIDFIASFASFLNIKIPVGQAYDSENIMSAFTGKSANGRKCFVKQGVESLAIIQVNWKYIEPSDAPASEQYTGIATGNQPLPQLYNLQTDPGEQNNVAKQHPEIVKALAALLQQIKSAAK